MSAQQAIGAMASTTEPPCPDCAMLLVTDAQLTSGPIETTRGPATAPIWEFTLEGTAVKVTRVAIANPVVVAPDDGRLGTRAGRSTRRAARSTAASSPSRSSGTRSWGQGLRRGLHGRSRRVRPCGRGHRHAASPCRALRRGVLGGRGTAHGYGHDGRPARQPSRAGPAAGHPGPRRASPLVGPLTAAVTVDERHSSADDDQHRRHDEEWRDIGRNAPRVVVRP